MGWVHPSGLGWQNAAEGIEDTGSPPHPRRLVHADARGRANVRRRPIFQLRPTSARLSDCICDSNSAARTDLLAVPGNLALARLGPRLEPICQSWTARERTLMATTRQVRRVHAIERCGACVAPQRAPALSCARTQRLLVNGATQFVFH